MEFKEEYLKQKVKEGVENGLFCYDADKENKGFLSDKLLYIMVTVMLKYKDKNFNYNRDNLKYIFSPILRFGDQRPFAKFYDVDIHYSNDFFKFTGFALENKDTHMPLGCSTVILGIGENGTAILGTI